MSQLKKTWKILKKGLAGFDEDSCFRYGAALSFYTLFSMAPAVLISVYIAGLFANDVDFQREVTDQFSRLVGDQGASGINVLLEALQNEEQSGVQLVIGFLVLLFSATNIFIQMQGAFNEIFQVKPREGKGILKQVLSRLMSLGMIVSLGFVMMISLIFDSLIVSLKKQLEEVFSEVSINLISLGQNVFLLLVVAAVVYALFHFLSDVRIKRSYKLVASMLISVFLFIGKFGISWYIGNSRFGELGGASASIIILMLWVYYSSLILFLGAELIKAMARVNEVDLPATRFATKTKTVKVNQ